jgi:hypothetical protein
MVGTNLFSKLFRNAALDYYWRNIHPVSERAMTPGGNKDQVVPTIQIISDEPYVPWEILRPFRKNYVDDFFFCERYALARWLTGPQSPDAQLPLYKIALVAPPTNLQYVQDEVAFIDKLSTDGRAKLQKIENKADLLALLKQEGTNHVLHFACHGNFNDTDPAESEVVLGDDILVVDEITGATTFFLSNRPLVFLNACETGRQGFGFTGLESFVERFLLGIYDGGTVQGANCFVGTNWKVTDDLACSLAQKFYEGLIANLTVGEAMRQARLAIKRAGDATHLSYSLYANPLARALVAIVDDQP